MSVVKPTSTSITETAIAGLSHVGSATPSAPGATIEVSQVDTATGVIITVSGVVGRNDAAVLSKQLHTVLDAAPSVVVVNLSHVLWVALSCRDVLTTARERASAAGIALHVVDPDHCVAGDYLAGAADQAWRATTGSQVDQ